ncbi:MAG TPA: hypothetical protein VFV08_10615, partial [Puia sp.]|nr:hypothetical protein [Puia sp.]
IHIEVDCNQHHHHHPDQAIKDLEKSLHDYQGGICELKIPQELIRWKLDEAVSRLSQFILSVEGIQNNHNKRA